MNTISVKLKFTVTLCDIKTSDIISYYVILIFDLFWIEWNAMNCIYNVDLVECIGTLYTIRLISINTTINLFLTKFLTLGTQAFIWTNNTYIIISNYYFSV